MQEPRQADAAWWAGVQGGGVPGRGGGLDGGVPEWGTGSASVSEGLRQAPSGTAARNAPPQCLFL